MGARTGEEEEGPGKRNWELGRGTAYLGVSLQLAHVVLLEPAAGIVRVAVRGPVEVGAHVLAGPRPQQLFAPRVLPHEVGEVVEPRTAADPAGARRQAPLDVGGGEAGGGGGGGRSGGHGGSGRGQRGARSSGAGGLAGGRVLGGRPARL